MRIGKHGFWEPEPRTPSKEESTFRKECKAGDVVSFKDDSYIVKDDGETCTGCAFDTDEYCRSDKHGMPDELPNCTGKNGFLKFVKIQNIEDGRNDK